MILFHLLFLIAYLVTPEWRQVAPGVQYREYRQGTLHAHVVKVDLRAKGLAVVATNEADKGMTVTAFARKYGTTVAINADYFDPAMRPVGHARGSRGTWEERHGTRNQPVIGFGRRRADIFRLKSRDSRLPRWVRHAVSGWPMVVEDCRALSSSQLPGSDFFTRAPHPRTAVGLSADGKTLHLVVADGRQQSVPGLTLAELGTFMREELGSCEAVNLDGGGSTEMVIEGRIVNRPSDGAERTVANHLGVVISDRQP